MPIRNREPKSHPCGLPCDGQSVDVLGSVGEVKRGVCGARGACAYPTVRVFIFIHRDGKTPKLNELRIPEDGRLAVFRADVVVGEAFVRLDALAQELRDRQAPTRWNVVSRENGELALEIVIVQRVCDLIPGGRSVAVAHPADALGEAGLAVVWWVTLLPRQGVQSAIAALCHGAVRVAVC